MVINLNWLVVITTILKSKNERNVVQSRKRAKYTQNSSCWFLKLGLLLSGTRSSNDESSISQFAHAHFELELFKFAGSEGKKASHIDTETLRWW